MTDLLLSLEVWVAVIALFASQCVFVFYTGRWMGRIETRLSEIEEAIDEISSDYKQHDSDGKLVLQRIARLEAKIINGKGTHYP